MDRFIVIFITCSSLEEAQKITRCLVNEKLLACGNVLPGIHSIFFWQEKVSEENEVLIIGKTVKSLFPSIVKRVKTLHSYTVPEIIALPLIEGSDDYLKWIEDTVQKHS